MMDNRLVNRLFDEINNAGGDIRDEKRIGKLLVNCQLHCEHWTRDTGCLKHKEPEWVELLIRPGRTCEFRGELS